MSISLSDIRITFLWGESNVGLLNDPQPPAPFAFLGRRDTFGDRFGSVGTYDGEDPDKLIPPWPQAPGKSFWSMYLSVDPHRLSRWDAWKQLVPFRTRWRASEIVGFPEHLRAEGFLYPNGIAVLVTVRLRPANGATWTLEQAVEAAHELRFGDRIGIRTADGSDTMRLDRLADAQTKEHWRRVYGPTSTPSSITTPYSVATFVTINGADSALALPDHGEVHRTLEAITRWPLDWSKAPLPDLGTVAIEDPHFLPGDIHYSGSRGRAVWLPGMAADQLRHRKLTCYHRNQAMAALQVLMLGEAVRTGAARLRQGLPLPLAQEYCTKRATGILSRLYGGSVDTYRSLACAHQMRQQGLVDDVNYLRHELMAKPPLA